MLARPRRSDVIPALSITCSSSRSVRARMDLTCVVVSGKWVSFVSGERRRGYTAVSYFPRKKCLTTAVTQSARIQSD
jgi:hypothetical protein